MKTRRPGFTLLELLIVAPLLVIASTIAFILLLRGWQAYNYSLAQTDASYQSVTTLDRVSRVLRSTSKIISAGSNDLTVEAYFSPRDAVPDRVRYFVSSSTLYVDVTPASGTAPNYTYLPGDKKTYKISSLLNTASDPLFRYYNESGTTLNAPPDIAAVREIELLTVTNTDKRYLRVNHRASTRVQLRNLKTNL